MKTWLTNAVAILSLLCDVGLVLLTVTLAVLIFRDHGFRHGIWAVTIVVVLAGCTRFLINVVTAFLLILLGVERTAKTEA